MGPIGATNVSSKAAARVRAVDGSADARTFQYRLTR